MSKRQQKKLLNFGLVPLSEGPHCFFHALRRLCWLKSPKGKKMSNVRTNFIKVKMLSRHFDFTTLSNFKGKTHLLSKLVNFWVWEPQRVFFLLVAEIMKVKFRYDATPKIWGPVGRPRKSHFSSLPGYQRDTSDSEQYRMTYLSMTSRVRSSMDLVLSITRAAIQACFSSPLSA